MSNRLLRWSLYLALPLLYALHNDFWWWNDGRLFLWLPIGLSYHLLFCVAVSLVMWSLVRWAWPPGLDDDGPAPSRDDDSETQSSAPEVDR